MATPNTAEKPLDFLHQSNTVHQQLALGLPILLQDRAPPCQTFGEPWLKTNITTILSFPCSTRVAFLLIFMYLQTQKASKQQPFLFLEKKKTYRRLRHDSHVSPGPTPHLGMMPKSPRMEPAPAVSTSRIVSGSQDLDRRFRRCDVEMEVNWK